jgi:hypothetical protein
MRALFVLSLLVMAPRADAAPDPRCTYEPAPVSRVTPRKAAPCHRAPREIAAALRAELDGRYLRGFANSTLQVTFPCDGLGPVIREIVIETGEGHGGSLELWRATRGTRGYDVRGIVYQGGSLTQSARPHAIATGTVAHQALELERVRAALVAKPREVRPRPARGVVDSPSWTLSSRDFHVVIRLVDDAGRVLERRYTGYAGSDGQDVYLGPELALEALAPITQLSASPLAPGDPDRALFAERFLAAAPHFDDEYAWWVMERMVDLSRALGSRALIPALLTRLVVDEPTRSRVDARRDAVDALARITGWDARGGPAGARSSDEDAAAAYLAACRPR